MSEYNPDAIMGTVAFVNPLAQETGRRVRSDGLFVLRCGASVLPLSVSRFVAGAYLPASRLMLLAIQNKRTSKASATIIVSAFWAKEPLMKE